jgi:hypothetical protein
MARTSRAETLEKYRSEVEWAVKWRDEAGYDQLWQRCIDAYAGQNLWPDPERPEDRIAVNVTFSTINVIYPSVSVNTPKIGVLANKPEDEPRAVYNEAIMNYWWKHHNFQQPFRLATKDFLIIGHGWVKVGWRFVEDNVALSEEELQAEYERRVADANSFAAENPDLAGGLPSDEEIATALVETKQVIVEDRPFIDRVSPFNIYVNVDATHPQDIRWIAQRIIMPLEQVKKDERYSSAARKRLKPTSIHKNSSWMPEEEREKYSSTVEYVILWEHYNVEKGTLCIWADGADEFLVDPMEVPYAFGHPFEMVRNYDVPDQFYPIGDIEMILPMQDELNKLRSQLMNYRKKYARKYVIRQKAFDKHGRAALESDDDNVAIPVVDDNSPLNDLIAPLPVVPMPPELFNYSDRTMSDIYEVSGVSEYQRGNAQAIRRTATEAALINDSTNARAAEKLAIVERFISNIARKLHMVAQQFVTGEQVARIVGRDGAMYWLEYERDDIIGEYDFTVEAGSTQPFNETFRRQQALAMVQAIAPFLQLGIINPTEVARYILREGFGVKNPEKFLQQAPMPVMGPMAEGAAPSGQGVDAPQMDPSMLLAAQQGEPGIGQGMMNQLAGQVGLNLGGG